QRVTVDDQVLAWYGGVVATNSDTDLQTPPGGLVLPPRHLRLEFEYTALSFNAPENAQFRYRLEGFDDRWVEAGTQRSASYSRLPAGKYTFRVNACNSEGIWNETGA